MTTLHIHIYATSRARKKKRLLPCLYVCLFIRSFLCVRWSLLSRQAKRSDTFYMNISTVVFWRKNPCTQIRNYMCRWCSQRDSGRGNRKGQRKKTERIDPTKMIKGVLLFRSLFFFSLLPSFTLVCARALFSFFSFLSGFFVIPKCK